jgi:dihydroorotate dehydrogenase
MHALYPLIRPLFFALDAETAHDAAFAALDLATSLHLAGTSSPRASVPVEAMGITFPNRVGLAAGLDKNGAHIDGLATLGFGFIEVGTVTPRPQPGNPRPRLFRLPQAEALINRLGFDTPNERAADDYAKCFAAVYARASYITVNVSSPNTAGLRDLQAEDALSALLARLKREQAKLADAHGRYVPLAVKIAPDLADDAIEGLARVLVRERADGAIATNTTLARDGVSGRPHAEEAGGLSGRPLRERATAVVRKLARALDRALPIIGVGGISSGEDAREKIAAGATLVQLYTGLVYRGPALVDECVSALGTGATR